MMNKLLNLKKFCTVYNSSLLNNIFNKGVKHKKIPMFEVFSSQIEILNQPIDYYLAIIKLIRSAKSRIVISSLYLGTGKMEEFIVEEIYKAIQKNNRLNVTILMDKSRGTREDNTGKTSLYLLNKLKIDTYPHAKYINISFFEHPYKKNFYDILPGIVSEVVGVQHTKVLVFDDYSILSGANLSKDYFSNRQDRYYVIQNCSPLSDYLEDFVKAISNVSFQLDNEGNLKLNSKYPNPYNNKTEYLNILLQQLKMFRYDNRVKIPSGEDLKINDYLENMGKFNNYAPENSEKSEDLKLIEFNKRSREDFETILPEAIQHMKNEINFKSKMNEKSSSDGDSSNKVLIMPIVQFNPIKENDDKEILMDLLSEKNLQKITVSSAYINFPEFLINKLNEIQYDVELITSAPQANSFYKAGMIKGNIPKFYRLFELNLLKKFKGKDNLHLYEFKRDGWTYHSKGIWFYENNKLEPNVTLIGSSNYNIRSYQRDLELQFFIYSFCDKMNKKFENEIKDNFLDCFEMDQQMIRKDRDTKITRKTKLFAKIFKDFL